jgi:hypothetical protein
MWNTGHALIKAKLKETGAPLAGEMSGHTFFKERWYGFDDGLYAGARLLEIVSRWKDANWPLKHLPDAISTPELNLKMQEGEPHALIAELQKTRASKGAQELITLDGLRVEYADGFGLMRASNTTPVLVLRFEADNAQALARIQADFTPWANRLIYGDNLLAMAALLAGDEQTPSLRGKIDLIYIDPPFDSKADYRTKVTLPGVELEQKPTVIEQFAYSDTWSDGTASYLAMITPRLILMRELLADTGSIYVHLDWHVGHYVKIVMDEVFGKDNFSQRDRLLLQRQKACQTEKCHFSRST